MKKVISAVAALAIVTLFYACNDDDYTTTALPADIGLVVATLNSQGTSTSATTGGSTATGTFSGNLNRTTNVMTYTVTYSGVTPTAITLDPVTTTSASGSTNSILLVGTLPGVSTPGSGTSTTPGSGTSTTPGSGTSTTPGSGTSTTPGSGTSTTPGSGTSTTPGSGTSTTPGTGTSTTPGTGTSTTPGTGTSTTPGTGTSTTPGNGSAVTITSPYTGSISVSSSRADSLNRGLYRLNIRSTSYPNGEIGGVIRAQ